jgi:hypothetical protein
MAAGCLTGALLDCACGVAARAPQPATTIPRLRAAPTVLRLRPGLIAVALFGVGCGIAAIRLRSFVLLHDEGLALQAAARIADGDWPYRDFWWNYGPGQPLLLAALQPLTGGPSLLVWRLLWVVEVAATGVLVFLLVRRAGGLPWALVAWAAALFLLVAARLPHPHVAVTVLALAALLLARTRPAVAGMLGGIAVFFRPELGVFAVAAVALAAGSSGARRALAAASVSSLLLLLPFIVVAGPGRFLGQTIGFDLSDQPLQRLPLAGSPPAGADLIDRLHYQLPLLLVCATAAAIALVLFSATRKRPTRDALALAVLGAGGAVYLLGRADLFHLVPLAAVAPALLALAATAKGRPRIAPWLCAAALAVLLVDGVTRRIDILDTAGATALVPGRAGDGIRTDPATAAPLARVGALLDREAPGAPIWVANARHDRVTSGATLAYVILDRKNATRYDVMQPGVVTERGVQEEIAADLTRTSAPVVRWLGASGALREDSAAARMSGSRLLDGFLARRYRVAATVGEWQLLLWSGR